MQLFGFEFQRKRPVEQQLTSFAQKDNEDGAVVVAAGGSYGTYVDLDGSVRTEAELVTKYREMSLQPECDAAIDEIVNETMSIDEDTVVKINLDNVKVSDNIKKLINGEFDTCLRLLDFNKYAYDIFRRWYIDGKLYYHVLIDEKNPKEGIKEIRYVDPRKIRKIREIARKRVQVGTLGSSGSSAGPGDATITRIANEYYIYNDKGFNYGNKPTGPTTNGLRIAADSILHVVSGITDNGGNMVLSYLHKGIKNLNQLRTLEDALVIYRLARAPERRIWYIDTGNLPKLKAEQYVRDIMIKQKNRLVYNSADGTVRDDRKFMTMLEDFFLPRKEGGRGTEVSTLPGGQTLGQMDDVLYFQKKFFQCLNVPVSRLNSDAMFSVGRATEITRDELKFSKFIIRLRARFAMIFTKMLEKQLVLKQIMTIEDWQAIAYDVKYDFSRDNYFTELKDAEILTGRINLARNFQDMAGKYYSHKWIRKTILMQSDEEIEDMDDEISVEDSSDEPRWINPAILQNIQLEQQDEAGAEGDIGDTRDTSTTPATDGNTDNTKDDKHEEVRQAKTTIELLKKKGPKNRSREDDVKFRSAVQVLAKNPSIAKSLGSLSGTAK
jgi:hypothetical protein